MDSFWRQAFPAQIQQDHGGRILDGLIDFKENILEEVSRGRLFNANYPLLIQHIQREAKLYRATVMELLDPSEEELILTADQFAMDYRKLMEKSRKQDCRAMGLTEETLKETLKYRDFKAAGADGILDCKIASIILPLLADHVLREANHYIRLLETDCDKK